MINSLKLPFGSNHFARLFRAFAGAVAAFMFCVSAQAQSTNLVGFWWKSSEPGWGLSVQQQGTSTFAVWYTYDVQGAPIWYTLTCSFGTGNTCAGDLYTAKGTPLTQITGSANSTAIKAGTGSLTLAGNTLSLAYTIGTVTQTRANIERFNFAASSPACTFQNVSSRANLTNYTDHWWGGSGASGWGIQISHQEKTVFLGWYSYNDQGTASWTTGIGTQGAANSQLIKGSIYRVPAGTPFSQIGNGTQPASTDIGTFELNFTDGEKGRFTYTLPSSNIAARSLGIERFAIAGGAVNVCGTVTSAITVTKSDAARFLGQATFGPRMAEVDALSASSYEAWLADQFSKAQTRNLPAVAAYIATLPVDDRRGQAGFTWTMWKTFSSSDDQLRQRMAYALSQIFVISLDSNIANANPRGPANYLDVLGENAFGNYRALLEAVTYSPMMGIYLSSMRNQKENPATGSVPDENYAREIMQLFSIGLYQLNQDGTQKLDGAGNPIETYTNADITGLAKVFTGLSWTGPDTSSARFLATNGIPRGTDDPDREIKPMQAYNQFHATQEKRFLGVTIPATSTADANSDIRIALDTLFNHPNVGPFIGKQLIQRLVTSNPSPAYVSRVAAAFNDNGANVRGDMKAVIRAILLDPEARSSTAVTAQSGKLREPAVRFLQWMRTFNAKSQDGRYLLGATSDPSTQLAQSPMRSPSVFNFYRPGYVPPNSRVGSANLVAPEMQITTETSVAGYLNFMRGVITSGIGVTGTGGTRDIQADYGPELALAANPDQLVDRVNLLLTGNKLSPTTRTLIRDAIASVNIGTTNPDADRRNRVNLAIYLTMASTEYLLQN
jgi:uncharacterized protein (DUF1800 family)